MREHYARVSSWTLLAEATGISAQYLSALSRDKTRQRIAMTKAAEIRAALATLAPPALTVVAGEADEWKEAA